MFRSLLSKVLDKVTNFLPVKRFIKYALDKTLNELLSNELKLQDFKNGELNLTNIDFNVAKINKVYLLASPYSMHTGSIGSLKISLPPLSQISTKSIEIAVEGVQIQLKPNKCFYQRFKQAMKEQQQQMMYNVEEKELQGQISQNGPVDFFKQLLKQIILNIKVKLKNVTVKLFMNQPAGQQIKSCKPQYYVMLRIRQILVGKNQEMIQKDLDIEEIKFNLEVPQISIHLLKEGISYPQYCNEYATQADFPFQYPRTNHPSTILLIGNSDIISASSSEYKKNNTKFILTMTTNYSKKKKSVHLSSTISNLQIMIDPIQLRIISRFIIQIQQFKKIYKYVVGELGLNNSAARQSIISQGLTMSRRGSKSNNHDLFSSMMMSINELATQANAGDGIVNSFLRDSKDYMDPDSKKEYDQFNLDCQKLLDQQKSEIKEEFRNIQFQSQFKMKFKLLSFRVYMLKYLAFANYDRQWMSSLQRQEEIINPGIGCSYFMAALNKLDCQFTSKEEITDLSIDSCKIYNVKLASQNHQEEESEEFYDIAASSQFYSSPVNSKPQLVKFQLKKKNHFCVQELFSMSQRNSSIFNKNHVKIFSFLPKGNDNKIKNEPNQYLQKSGMRVYFKGKEKSLKVTFEEISVSLNAEVLKDVINIAYPVFAYKKLSQAFTFKQQQINFSEGKEEDLMKKKDKFKSIFESQYFFVQDEAKIYEEMQAKQKKLDLYVSVELVKFAFRQSTDVDEFQSLYQRAVDKQIDADNFSHSCFCNTCSNNLYAQLRQIVVEKKKEDIKLSSKVIDVGRFQIIDSTVQIQNLTSLIRVEGQSKKDMFRVYIVKDKLDNKIEKDMSKQTLSVYIPGVTVSLQQEDIFTILQIVKRTITIIDNLIGFSQSLKNRINAINQQTLNLVKTTKKPENNTKKVLEVYVEEVKINVLFLSIYARELFAYKCEEQLSLKLETLVVGMKSKYKTYLGEMKNKLLLVSQYPLSSKYPGINDAFLILEIGGKHPHKKVLESKVKTQFYQKECELPKNIMISINKSNGFTQCHQIPDLKSQSKSSNGFKFQKNPIFKANMNSSEPILEERNSKTIEILISHEINVYVINAFKILAQKDRIMNLTKGFSKMKDDIIVQSKSLMTQRKNSNQSEIQTEQLTITLKPGRLNLDIRPQFEQNGKCRTFSNTRSIVSLCWDRTSIRINSDNKSYSIQSRCDVLVWFLKHQDRQIAVNPLLMVGDYQQYGFKNIVQVRQLLIDIQALTRQNKLIIRPSINDLTVSMSLTTIAHINLHLEHFLKHHIQQNYGKSQAEINEEFQILEGDQEEIDLGDNTQSNTSPIQDLSDCIEYYNNKLQEKKKHFNEFKLRDFNASLDDPQIKIVNFRIKKIKIKLTMGSDFNFISVESLNQSKQRKRQLADDGDLLNYICLFVEGVALNLQIKEQISKEKTMQLRLQMEKLQLQLSSKKSSQGFFTKIIKKNYGQQVIFSLLKSDHPLSILVHHSSSHTKIKISKIQMSVGFTSQVMRLMEQMNKQAKNIENSGWRKIYQRSKNKNKEKDVKIQEPMALLFIPQGKLSLTLQYLGKKILQEQTIRTSDFLLHEQMSNTVKITSIITNWCKQLILSNVGGLLGGAAVNLFSGVIQQIISFLRWIVGGIIGKGQPEE